MEPTSTIKPSDLIHELLYNAVIKEDFEKLDMVLEMNDTAYMNGWDVHIALNHPTLYTIVVKKIEMLWKRFREEHQRYGLLCAVAGSENPDALSILVSKVLSLLSDDELLAAFKRPPNYYIVDNVYSSPFDLSCNLGLEKNVDELLLLFKGRSPDLLSSIILQSGEYFNHHVYSLRIRMKPYITIFHALATSIGTLEFVTKTVKFVLETLLISPLLDHLDIVKNMLSSHLIVKTKLRKGPLFYTKRPGQTKAFLDGICSACDNLKVKKRYGDITHMLLLLCVTVPAYDRSEFVNPCMLLLQVLKYESKDDFNTILNCLQNESDDSLFHIIVYACITVNEKLISSILKESPLSRRFAGLLPKFEGSKYETIVRKYV